jgi:hypothetical protein
MLLLLITYFGFAQTVSYGQEIPSFATNNTINVNGTNLVIQYGITAAKIVSINADTPSKSLIVLIQSTGDGILNMTLPRTLIDAKQNGDDTHFTVLVNNHGINYDEVESFTHRTLSIPFHLGTKDIRIIGTQMLMQSTNLSVNPPQAIKALSTDNPPIIDGKWSRPSEWNQTNASLVERNGSEMYVLAQTGIIKIHPPSSSTHGPEIPSWIKNITAWWSTSQVDDAYFSSMIQWIMQTSSVTQSNQETPKSLVVNTGKSSYIMGDTIVISGAVNPVIAGTPVTIIILDPNYLLLEAEQIHVSPDGSFESTILTTPYIWKLSGTYTISAQYGLSNVKTQTTFNFAS